MELIEKDTEIQFQKDRNLLRVCIKIKKIYSALEMN